MQRFDMFLILSMNNLNSGPIARRLSKLYPWRLTALLLRRGLEQIVVADDAPSLGSDPMGLVIGNANSTCARVPPDCKHGLRQSTGSLCLEGNRHKSQ